MKRFTYISTKINLILACLVMTFFGCDQFNEDLDLEGENAISLEQSSFTTTFDAPVVINLTDKLASTEIAGFRTSLQPSHGSLDISKQGIIVYRKFETLDAPAGDIFAFDFLRTDSTIIDTDSIEIVFVTDTSEIPCLNGAISDFINIPGNGSINFNVLWNDGYCDNASKDVTVQIIESPKHGQIITMSDSDFISFDQLPVGTITYIPNTGYTGNDQFLYKLNLIDQSGQEHISYAYVYISIGNGSEDCSDVKANDDYYIFHPYTEEEKLIFPLENDMLCPDVKLLMGTPSNGELIEHENGVYSYFSTAPTCDAPFPECFPPDDVIEYQLIIDGDIVASTGQIFISFSEDDTLAHCDALPHAEDDFLFFHQKSEVLVLDVLQNDFWCESISLVDAFDDRVYANGFPYVEGNTLKYAIEDPNIPFDEVIEYAIEETSNPSNFATGLAHIIYEPNDSTIFEGPISSISYEFNSGFCVGLCLEQLFISDGVVEYFGFETPEFDTLLTHPGCIFEEHLLEEISHEISLDEFYDLEENYFNDFIADVPIIRITVASVNGDSKTVSFDTESSIPPALENMHSILNQILIQKRQDCQ